MISASSRAFVLNGETTTWRTKLRKVIIEADYLIVSVRPVDGVFGMDSRRHSQSTWNAFMRRCHTRRTRIVRGPQPATMQSEKICIRVQIG